MTSTDLYPRELLEDIKTELFSPYIIIIMGSRRVGKTSLLMLLREQIIKEGSYIDNILYFDLENPVYRENFEQSNYDLIVQHLLSRVKNRQERIFVFLDEIQYLKNPAGFLKYMYDHYKNLKFIVSGSSSLKIKKIFSDSMVGRKRMFRLYPLSFREFLIFKNKISLKSILRQINFLSEGFVSELKNTELLPSVKSEVLDEIYNYFTFGGYPETTLINDIEGKKKSLFEFYTSYIQKDISFLFSIENIEKFNKLVKLYAVQIGNLVNFSEISNTLGISRNTIDRYSFLQNSTFVLEFVSPFYSNIRKELTKMPKVYFEDIGVRNAVLNTFPQAHEMNIGNLAENFVFTQLLKRYPGASITYWRTKSKQEVDFVISLGNRNIPLEVKFSEMKKPALPKGLRAFIDYYKPEKAIIVTKDCFHVVNRSKTTIVWMPIYFI